MMLQFIRAVMSCCRGGFAVAGDGGASAWCCGSHRGSPCWGGTSAKSLIVPLLFGTLVVGIAGHGDDMKRVGKLAFRSILYFEIVTTLALVVGLLAVNIVKPGRGVNIASASAETGEQLATTHTTFAGVIEHTVPQSFFEAASKNEVLQIVFFAIIFGFAMGADYMLIPLMAAKQFGVNKLARAMRDSSRR